jgi:hypothetical protein
MIDEITMTSNSLDGFVSSISSFDCISILLIKQTLSSHFLPFPSLSPTPPLVHPDTSTHSSQRYTSLNEVSYVIYHVITKSLLRRNFLVNSLVFMRCSISIHHAIAIRSVNIAISLVVLRPVIFHLLLLCNGLLGHYLSKALETGCL